MNTLKRIFVGIIIAIIVLCAVFYSYSAIENSAVVYAVNQDGTLTNDELDIAISSLLESHGGNLFSPQNYRARKTYESGLLHNFIYGDGGGYDAIRQHINGGVGGNNELKFDFDGFIIQKLNTWLNRELQNGTFGEDAELNENGMFDDGVNNNLYSGRYFVDADGIGCLMYISNGNSYYDGTITAQGTPYKYSHDDILNISQNSQQLTFHTTENKTINETAVYWETTANNKPKKIINSSTTNINLSYTYLSDQYTSSGYHHSYIGYPAILYANGSNKIYLIRKVDYYADGTYVSTQYNYQSEITNVPSENNQPVNIVFYTNNNNNVSVYPTIVDADGHLYITPKVNVGVDGEVNYQPYVVNEGDTINNVINQYYIDSNTPDKTISVPSDDPAGGGGGGGSSDNPSGGNPPDWSNNFPHLSPDGEGGFNFNFQLPDLNIDWNISGLTEKFPFSIPFDLLAFCRILDAEPETPRFEGDLVLPMLTYHIDLNLERFDTIAQLLRNLEFVGFCIGLLLITRSMIKG